MLDEIRRKKWLLAVRVHMYNIRPRSRQGFAVCLSNLSLPEEPVVNDSSASRPELFRIWKVRGPAGWRPTTWDELPPHALALEPAEAECFSADGARSYLAGFNQRMLDDRRRLWALAVPVQVAYDGDLREGDRLDGRQLKLP